MRELMPDSDIDTILSEAFRRLNEISRRLRTVEERLELAETNISSNKDAVIKIQSDSLAAIEKISLRIKNFEDKLVGIENEILRLSKAIEKTAKSVELEELRGTISLLNPLQSKFTTEEDVRRLIGEEKDK